MTSEVCFSWNCQYSAKCSTCFRSDGSIEKKKHHARSPGENKNRAEEKAKLLFIIITIIKKEERLMLKNIWKKKLPDNLKTLTLLS